LKFGLTAITDHVPAIYGQMFTGTPPDTRTLDLVPAPGHEFLMTALAGDRRVDDDPTVADPTIQVVVGGKSRPLTLDPRAMGGTLVISVPTGADAVLRVSDAGVVSQLSLRTGASPAGGTSDHSCRKPRSGGNTTSFTLLHGTEKHTVLTSVRAEQKAWLAGRGWAPSGRCWLQVSIFDIVRDGSTTLGLPGISADPDITSITLGGKKLPISASSYDVKDTAVSLSVRLSLDVSRASDGGSVRWYSDDGWSAPTTLRIVVNSN
jgi:hypothetical protein